MRKGIGGILVSLILITSIAAVIPMATGVVKYSIHGYKLDANGNGLANWTIEVFKPSNGFFVTKMTDENGYWEVLGLLKGTYMVTEVLEDYPGWMQLEPGAAYNYSWTVTITGDDSGGENRLWNFTNEKLPEPGTGTPGYWKNHPEAWPVDEITIGNETYNVTEAIVIMDMPDGDKTYTMFRALVAAKLNVLIGNDDSCIADTITAADAWMATYGPAGSGVHADDYAWQEGEALKDMLDDYNNGELYNDDGELCVPSRDDLENGTDTGTSETDTTVETTVQENGEGKKKPKK